MPDEFELSRRKALAALGTVGVASAGAGLGTSAFFSDQETFENSQLTAGTLDMTVGWEEHYSDWSEDEAEHARMEDGELVVDDQQGFMNATLQEEFPDKRPPIPLCEALADVPDDLEKPVIELSDVKPGDFGEVTFTFALCDNPGYVWMNGSLLANAENDLTEPERDDPNESDGATGQQLPGNPLGGGELADSIRTTIWYDDDCDNTDERDTPCISKRELTGSDEFPDKVCKFRVLDIPEECEDAMVNLLLFEGDDIYIPCEDGDCPLDKEHVWVVHGDPMHAACRITVQQRTGCRDPPNDLDEVWEYDADWTDKPCAAPEETEQEIDACKARFVGITSESGCEWFEQLDESEGTIWLKCEAVTHGCPLSEGTHRVWFQNPAEPGEICLVDIEVEDTTCRGVFDRVWDVDQNWNRQEEQLAFSGTLRETMAVLSQGHGIPLDGRTITDFAELDGDEPAPGTAASRECYTPSPTHHCVGFKWELPVDHGNEVQSDSVRFDLGFYTEQCRHNDGAGMNDESVDDDEVAL